ncbi:MAG TPA: hypothetical protein VJP40_08930 [bacterium]|nr:hypothetical protein [bacterium]
MYGPLPADTLAELLLYLNDHESFDSLKGLGSVSRQALAAALTSLAAKLKAELPDATEPPDFKDWKEVTEPFRKLLAQLSPREAKLLLKGLGN